jgi:hypothetical protein
MPTEVLHLWRVDIRKLNPARDEWGPFSWHIATSSEDESVAVHQARGRFTPEWWDEHIITAVEKIGKLHIIDGCNLFEKD